MKFEEVLPALREGKKIRRKCMPYGYCHIKNNHIVRENGSIWSDSDIKKLQIVFNNLKQIQEECMALPTYHRRKQ